MITGSELSTRRRSLSFTVNEVSRNKVAVPKGAAGLSTVIPRLTKIIRSGITFVS